jgi:hypothetical protein
LTLYLTIKKAVDLWGFEFSKSTQLPQLLRINSKGTHSQDLG